MRYKNVTRIAYKKDPVPGPSGGALCFRKDYSSTTTYVGAEYRRDVVKYNGFYYAAKVTAGSFSGIVPTNTAYWQFFSANYENVATGLFLAELAFIENLGVHELVTEDSDGNVGVRISNDINGMQSYDEDGNIAATFDGKTISSINQLFGGGSANYTPSNSGSLLYSRNAPSDNYFNIGEGTLLSFTTVSAGVITIPRVSLFARALENDTRYDTSGPYSMTTVTMQVIVDGAIVASHSHQPDSGTVGSTAQFNNIQVALAAGSHTIQYRFIKMIGALLEGNVELRGSVTFTGQVQVISDRRLCRYFANGFAVGSSTGNFFEVLLNSGLTLRAIAGSYGINITPNGLQIRLLGSWYTVSRNSGTGALTLTQASLIE